jgi:hypothetical protein
MNSQGVNLADWITAISTVVYTGGTLLLWWTTKKSLEANNKALKLNILLALRDLHFIPHPTQFLKLLKEVIPEAKEIESQIVALGVKDALNRAGDKNE